MIEIAANSVASALAAQEGGAHRIELCAALEIGGLTPSHAQIALARERVDLPMHVLIRPRTGDFDNINGQSSHHTGGVIMGTDPKTSALNRYLQSWDVPNLFVTGASAFPQNAGYNPTGTLAALAFWAANAIRTQYLKNPGQLIHA